MYRLQLILLSAALANAQTTQDRFDRLMRDVVIFDAHVDTPRYIVDEGYQMAEEHSYYETDIPRLKRGRVGAVLFGIYAEPQSYPPNLWLPRALECLDGLRQQVRLNAKHIQIAATTAPILPIH